MRAAIGMGRRARCGLIPAFLALALSGPLASANEAEPASDNALATLCGIVETSAQAQGLPVNFFTRLIWRESAFQPGAVSPAGAHGRRPVHAGHGLRARARRPVRSGGRDPGFGQAPRRPSRSASAISASRRPPITRGPNAVAGWLSGAGAMPIETQDLRARDHRPRRRGMARRQSPRPPPRRTGRALSRRRSEGCASSAARRARPSSRASSRRGACRSPPASPRARRCAPSPASDTTTPALSAT